MYVTLKIFEKMLHSTETYQFESCAFFVLLNICSDSEAEEIDVDDVGPSDKDICCVYEKVALYMQIAQDTTVHMVPKAIMHHIIRKVEKFINTDLLFQILDDIDTNVVGFFHGFSIVLYTSIEILTICFYLTIV